MTGIRRLLLENDKAGIHEKYPQNETTKLTVVRFFYHFLRERLYKYFNHNRRNLICK
jgi:hypothetical protein